LSNPESDHGTVGDVAVMPAKITESASLAEALDALGRAEATGMPVLDRGGHSVVGWLTYRTVLSAL
ncbi:CBS domain-containing protein, partial [Nocardia sp. NPDC020380]|uniref:CBS domain-containing protein n=1 Tax=Nocardia sp. NPDC020380 TaxID=3364309 RepID=UPI0037A9C719